MFTDNYGSSFCFWVFEKRLTQKNCFLFCKKCGWFNRFIFLTVKKFLLSYFPKFHGQRFWVFEKRLTQENCFLFCEKYGLFNGFISSTIKKFLLSYFPKFHGQRSGEGVGQDLSIHT